MKALLLVTVCLVASSCERLLTLGDDSRGNLVNGCEPTFCTLACPDGFAVDDNGCERCACKASPDAAIEFDSGIPDAGEVDAGLPDAGCGVGTDCQLVCEFGFARNITGCEECACASAPPDGGCGPSFCQMPCPNGYKRNAQGCGLCVCSPMPAATCMPPTCALTCPGGFNADSSGCALCECSL